MIQINERTVSKMDGMDSVRRPDYDMRYFRSFCRPGKSHSAGASGIPSQCDAQGRRTGVLEFQPLHSVYGAPLYFVHS